MAFFSGSRGGDAFATECLKAMNDYRARHQVSALRLNPQISKISQSWADQMARSNNFSHNRSAIYNGVDLGENIAMKWNSNKTQFSGQEIVEMWYNEIKNYSFRTHSGPQTGHFTQLVWKASTEVGIGKAVAPDGKFLVVANFNPPGNFVGRFGENVLPPKDGKIVLESGSAQPSKAAMPPRSTQAVEDHSSLYSRASPAHFGRDPGSNSSSNSSSSSPFFQQSKPSGLYPGSSSSGGGVTSSSSSSSSSVTRRQVVQETTGRGPNAVTKTVVIETVRNPDGSTRTVQTESCSSRDQPSSSCGFGEIEKKFGMFRINRNEGPTQSSAQASPCTVTSKKYTVSSNVTPVSGSPWSVGAAGAGREVAGSGSSPSTGSSSTGTQSMKEFTDDIIKSHNKYRRKHGQVGDVKLNKDLSEIAQRWAERLAASRSMQHSDNKFQGLPLGENLASKYGSGKIDYKGDEVVADWYSEIKDYDFRNSDRSVLMSTGHFTQVVWKGSREIGVGRATSRDGSIFVVCNYFPAGNVIGKFRENVLPG